MLLDFVGGSSRAFTTTLITLKSIKFMLNVNEVKVKKLFQTVVVDITRRNEDDHNSFYFKYNEEKNVAKEHHDNILEAFNSFKAEILKVVDSKMKDFGDQIGKDIKAVSEISSGVQTVIDKLIYDVNTLLEDNCAFNVEYEANLYKKKQQFNVVIEDLKTKLTSL